MKNQTKLSFTEWCEFYAAREMLQHGQGTLVRTYDASKGERSVSAIICQGKRELAEAAS